MTGSDAKADQSRKRKSKKRSKSDLDDSTVVKDASTAGMDAELDVQEPTMAEKLASLELQNDGSLNGKTEEEATHSTNIPSADSVHVMLKQALNADDHSLLLSCLYTSDDKVFFPSIYYQIS
ncbi:hypothetical protein AXF42_Ash010738 [Apostasia shenzhenica]|uniref:Uncharacterized protein n=1 Tax=Apostasia shenzhenica TaxID=1088818 RepID=A0A2I0A0K8_9ASPA|nr:hypothetical protein AXF42_Ash010738 [Apostasia shenzhenica]